MVTGLFGQKRPQLAGMAPQVPAGSRVYAVGDIHGRADLLHELHRMIASDAGACQATRKVVVYVGDYIDRGASSAMVIDLLLDQPLQGFESVHLMGNHEQSLLTFLSDLRIGPEWMAYGGAQTLASYGVEPPRTRGELARAQIELKARLPERHLRFMAGLRLTHEEGDYLFAHAGLRPGVPLARQIEDDLLWIRDEFLHSDAEFGKIVVHGHSISEWPEIRRNRIGIDTGAFATDRLSAVILEGGARSFLHT